MNCKSVQNNLSAYLDRELSGAEMLAIRSHLGDCEDCRAEEQSLRALKRLLAASAVPEPSRDLADRLCASVLANQRPKPVPAAGSTMRTVGFTFLGVAACSMALTYSLLVHGRPAPVPTDPALSVANHGQSLDFDVQRDQVYATGFDATGGVPVLATPQDLGR